MTQNEKTGAETDMALLRAFKFLKVLLLPACAPGSRSLITGTRSRNKKQPDLGIFAETDIIKLSFIIPVLYTEVLSTPFVYEVTKDMQMAKETVLKVLK